MDRSMSTATDFEEAGIEEVARRLHIDVAQLFDTFTNVDRGMRENVNSYKKQIQALQESNERLQKSRDFAMERIQELEVRYHQAIADMKMAKTTDKGQLASLEAELKLKKFESARTAGILTEAQQRFSVINEDNKRLLTTIDMLKEERMKTEIKFRCEMNTLKLLLKEKVTKLESYESMESHIDALIFNTAGSKVSENEICEKLGMGNLPINLKRRIKYSLDLATKVVELERECMELKNELFAQRDLNSKLRVELDAKDDIVTAAGLPISDLIRLLQKRDDELAKMRREDECLNALSEPFESGDVGKILRILKGLLLSRKDGRKNWEDRMTYRKICRDVGYSKDGKDVSVTSTPSKEDIQKLVKYVSSRSRPLTRVELEDRFIPQSSTSESH